MSLKNRNLATLLIGILGAAKLILQAFGLDVITNQQVDAIANGVAAIVTVIGVIMTHIKHSGGTGGSGTGGTGIGVSGGNSSGTEPSGANGVTSTSSRPHSVPPQDLTIPGPSVIPRTSTPDSTSEANQGPPGNRELK